MLARRERSCPAFIGAVGRGDRVISQDDQKGRPARPQARPTRDVLCSEYIEDAGEMRTKLPCETRTKLGKERVLTRLGPGRV